MNFATENELYVSLNEYAKAFGLDKINVKIDHDNLASRNNWHSDMKIKDNIYHSFQISKNKDNTYEFSAEFRLLTKRWQEHYDQFLPIMNSRDFK